MKVALIFGTRPEAIKMAPLAHALQQRSSQGFAVRVYVTAQHRDMLDQVLRHFGITPDADLNTMQAGQQLADLTGRMLSGIDQLLAADPPDLVLVHGDTTTALAAALAAYYRRIPVGHVEAGLRTWNRYSPFPEEMNRQVVDKLSTYHFAPTTGAVANLEREGIDPAGIVQTGNTVIDALYLTLRRIGDHGRERLLARIPHLATALSGNRRMILVTSHRRENHGAGLEGICAALCEIVRRHPDVEVVFPVHPNPDVRKVTNAKLNGQPRIHLIQPLEYDLFCYLMNCSYVILTDSGGIQEEAPALHKPVLVLRDTSERPEAVAVGAARVVGTDPVVIVSEASQLLANRSAYRSMAEAGSPYGDGRAAERIVDWLQGRLPQRRAA
jgi:UDP-N-acetylglucosamine 2-epimerase (hydrolysing)